MTASTQTLPQHVDVLVVGAGLTGIGVGHHLRKLQPAKTFAILEARGAMPRRPYIDMGTGYVNRAMHLFPQQGTEGPWVAAQDYKNDRRMLGKDPIEDTALSFAVATAKTLDAVR
ncbi:hypothetical protein [Rhodococcus sp. 077-4]|uniref:hypothetical protein n=1 Tax=Rhodococcus sp. 077-4 TaxID=2789271 RepID=UPI0039F5B1E9